MANEADRTERVAVAMSGGVDSSVAALRLVRAGYDVVGFFLRNGVSVEGPGSAKSCCSVSDASDARLVADSLGIPFYSLDVSETFSGIISRFVDSYRRGRTPNPCVECNVDVKFGRLLDLALSVDARRVASGHYARVRNAHGRHVLSRGADPEKDQSYVLATLGQEQLSRAMFPLGGLDKCEVREIARRAGLPVASKPESQEICFVPTGDYRDLIADRSSDASLPGDIVTTDGSVVGRHDGIAGFTVGQRRGLDVALGRRMHVVRVEVGSRRVVIGTREEASTRRFEMKSANWVSEPEPFERASFEVTARIRHRHRGSEATATWKSPGRLTVRFAKPEFAVTPGQIAVLYVGDDVLAAGTISLEA